ncbi:MAG: hypothetical protein JNJ41_11960 [Bacteroidia bacterium]|nr:hypothetical protein [Bacteroidia bacterium]
MKRYFHILFFALIALPVFSQVPNKINYQGVARNASGNPIANQSIGLQFKISTSTNSNLYNETQPSVPTNSFGLFATKIGEINPLPLNGWEDLPVILTVSINDGSGFTPLATQTLASVPYALYALKAGNALPTGTVNGQTLYWDNFALPPSWKIDNNLTNDGTHVGIGIIPAGLKNRLHVTTLDPNDSSVVFSVHLNATSKTAAARGIASGSSPSNSGNPFSTAIFGSQYFGINSGPGVAVGSYGQGLGDSLAIGLAGIATVTNSTGRAIGLYASSPLPSGDNFAAVFDKGKVFISDSLFLGSTANPGNFGDVLTRSSTGKVRWQAPGAAGSGPFTSSANYIHAAPSFTTNKIVFGVPYPAGGFPFQSRFTVVNSATNSSDTTVIISQLNGTKPALYTEVKGSGYAISAYQGNSSPSAYAGFFDGGLISKGKNSLPTAYSFLAKDGVNTDLFSVRNDGFVGIGTSSQTSKLTLVGTNGNTGYPYSNSADTRLTILNNNGTNNNYSSIDFTSLSSSFGIYSASQIVSENVDHLASNLKGNLIFLTRDPGNINEKMRITWDGRVGINTPTPTALLDVNGNTKLGANGTPVTNLIHGIASVTLPSAISVPGISSPLNISISGINPGDRVYVTLTPNANTVSHGVFITTAIVSVANNLEITLGALINGSVPAASNFTINYMIIKP